jgi:hypothetical protein
MDAAVAQPPVKGARDRGSDGSGLVSALVGLGISAWVELLSPAWILALSLNILTGGPLGPIKLSATWSPRTRAVIDQNPARASIPGRDDRSPEL